LALLINDARAPRTSGCGQVSPFYCALDCGATVPQRDRLWRVEWPLFDAGADIRLGRAHRIERVDEAGAEVAIVYLEALIAHRPCPSFSFFLPAIFAANGSARPSRR
jgi:hypothetical protein